MAVSLSPYVSGWRTYMSVVHRGGYTTHGKAITQTICNAADSGGSVTDAEYAQWLQYIEHKVQAWFVHRYSTS